MCSDASVGCPGHGGAMAGDTELSARVARLARGGDWLRGEGENARGLTAVP